MRWQNPVPDFIFVIVMWVLFGHGHARGHGHEDVCRN